MWPAPCKFPILFSIVKLKLGHITFSNSSIDSKLGLLKVSLRLYSQFLFNSQRNFKFGISEWCSCCTTQYFPIHGRDWNVGLKIASFHICIIILWLFKCWKNCFQSYMRVNITNFSWGSTAATPPNLRAVFGTNHTSLMPCFAQIFPNVQYFPNYWWMQIFLLLG